MHILLLGDSLIEYFNWQKRFPEHTCINLGQAGESVDGLLLRLGITKEVCPDVDMIFLMTGINNIAMGDVEFLNSYRAIIEKLRFSYQRARIFVNSLLPVSMEYINNSSITNANTSLKTLSDETGVKFLDIYSRFIDRNGDPIREYLLDDGVHLSPEGYAAWSGTLEGIIDS